VEGEKGRGPPSKRNRMKGRKERGDGKLSRIKTGSM